jgi:hypothetical protein
MLSDMAHLSKNYCERVKEEEGRTPEEVWLYWSIGCVLSWILFYVFVLYVRCLYDQMEVMNVGKVDPKRHLEADVTELLANSIVQCLGTMIDTVAF